VTPVPDEIRGEEVFAFIVPNTEFDDAAALAASIVETCAARLAYHKLPGYIAIVEELPLSSTRKLARGEIKTLAAACVGDKRAIDMRALKAKLRHAQTR
jgi:acyl-coenzyme A synthetase/AMP-(fatty) acid ligase